MPRRYAPDGTPLYFGKRPEEFSPEDTRRFIDETNAQLHGKELNNMATTKKTEAVTNAAPEQETPAVQAPQPEQDKDSRLLMDAPIAELAAARGISIDEAVKLRVDAAVKAATTLTLNVRPFMEPKGKQIGMAEVRYGGIAVDNFKLFNGKNGLFVAPPSERDDNSPNGYRKTARVSRRLQPILDSMAYEGYNAAVEKAVARAAALQAIPRPSIHEDLTKGAEQAAKDNAARPVPAMAGKAAER